MARSGWNVQIRADKLTPGMQFVFEDQIGGEGEVLTVTGIGIYFGTVSISVEEEDFDIDVTTTTMLSVVGP